MIRIHSAERGPACRRVAFISEHASPLATLGGIDAGGQNVYVHQLARCLAQLGHEVDIYTRHDCPNLPSLVETDHYRVVHIPAGPCESMAKESLLPHMPAFVEAVKCCWQEGPPYDVVHAHFFMSAMVALDLRRQFGSPTVVTFHALGKVRRMHQGRDDAFPPARFSIEDQAVQEADLVISECPQDRSDLVQYCNADPSKLRYAPCGIDLDEFPMMTQSQARRLLGWKEQEFVLLHVGRMVPRKGIETIVRSLNILGQRYHEPVRLVVVGGNSTDPDPERTPEIQRLQKIAESEGVLGQVEFVGARPRVDLNAFYRACDVFVTTPWYEPFGMTPLEAMACAKPVVGSAVGGISHTVLDGITGFLVPPKNPNALADRIAHCAKHPQVAARMGEEGRKRAASHFTWEHVARRMSAIYSEAACRRSALGGTTTWSSGASWKSVSPPFSLTRTGR